MKVQAIVTKVSCLFKIVKLVKIQYIFIWKFKQ